MYRYEAVFHGGAHVFEALFRGELVVREGLIHGRVVLSQGLSGLAAGVADLAVHGREPCKHDYQDDSHN